MARAIALLALAGVGWWTYQNGHLVAFLERFDLLPATNLNTDERNASLVDDFGGPSPILATVGSGVSRGDLSKEQRLIWDNTDVLSGWAQQNPNWTAAMIRQESGGNPKAVGPSTKWGKAYGLMQVLEGTAQQMFDAGWDRFQPDRGTLLTARGSIYFGTAYLEYLSRINSDREWMTKAYHGGPAGEAKGLWGPKTNNYLKRVQGHYLDITKGATA